jgi:hypothetical protein
MLRATDLLNIAPGVHQPSADVWAGKGPRERCAWLKKYSFHSDAALAPPNGVLKFSRTLFHTAFHFFGDDYYRCRLPTADGKDSRCTTTALASADDSNLKKHFEQSHKIKFGGKFGFLRIVQVSF